MNFIDLRRFNMSEHYNRDTGEVTWDREDDFVEDYPGKAEDQARFRDELSYTDLDSSDLY
nr:MAG TPA: hypothetical protein [Bacteriophage sp.]